MPQVIAPAWTGEGRRVPHLRYPPNKFARQPSEERAIKKTTFRPRLEVPVRPKCRVCGGEPGWVTVGEVDVTTTDFTETMYGLVSYYCKEHRPDGAMEFDPTPANPEYVVDAGPM
jgi:hypothetical protein